MAPPTLPELLDSVRLYLAANVPGFVPGELIIRSLDGRKLQVPILPCAAAPVRPVEPEPEAEPLDTFQASPDYRSFNWYGTQYTFSPTQAACVKVLVEAYENGTPDVGQATILERAGSDCNHLRDLFRSKEGKKAWGKLIIPGTSPGTFRLANPD